MEVRGHKIGAGADLAGADLTDADLRSADLSGSWLGGAILTGSDLSDARLVGAHLPRTRGRERGPWAVYACPPRRGPKIVRSHRGGGVLVRSPQTRTPPCTPGRRRTRRGGRRGARGSRRRAQVHRGCTGGATNEERGGDRTFAGSWRRWRGASPPSRL